MVLTHGTKLIRLGTKAANPNLSNSKARVRRLAVGVLPARRVPGISTFTEPEELGRDVPDCSWGLSCLCPYGAGSHSLVVMLGKDRDRDRDRDECQAFLMATEFKTRFPNGRAFFSCSQIHLTGMCENLFFSSQGISQTNVENREESQSYARGLVCCLHQSRRAL